jgi:hypothetical protein
MFGNQPFKITLWGQLRILNGPGTKSRLFEVPETFLARLNGTSRQASAIFRAKKVEGTSKSQDFVQGTI